MRLDEVDGMRVATFGTGPRLIIAVHGITASLMAWATVARLLPADWSLVAMDLRGRGHSAALPGPYGLTQHAEDVLRVADHVGAGPEAVLTGHSMGAYVAALAGAERDFARVVLVDGGLPLPMPEGADPDEVLEATLGPAMERLRRTFPTPEAYVGFFMAHPAFLDNWNADAEAYVRYDLIGTEGALRSRVAGDAVREDGRWMLTESERIGAALSAIRAPLSLLRAPRGLLDQDTGMLPDALAATWTARLPGLTDEVIPGCNHYTIMFDERCASVVADRLTSGF
ncbi:alpha/beta fold hydrolase [Nonomuraea aurantiaca]|uniref:alpha/beta fold hydrolase n=1 Tax=Nonomuraea aurantiaca TaxID=2878562 RepID=UPI001CD9ADA7|nr:alpha/beta hydrolase [Nonomuraea aurantiaca]MCA2227544.1 alpha/beta hydrolase [Nonomuraea aurantiaca]